MKNILACPDSSAGPPEPSGPARIFFTARARETALSNAPRAWRKPGEKYEKTGSPPIAKNQESQEIRPGGLQFLGLANIVSGVEVGETGSARPKIAVARVFFIGEHQETCELLPWGG